MRVAVIATGICLSIVGLALADDARASIRKLTEIHAQGLGSALQALAKGPRLQIVCRADLVKDLRTPGFPANTLRRRPLFNSWPVRILLTATLIPTPSPSSPSSPAPRARRHEPFLREMRATDFGWLKWLRRKQGGDRPGVHDNDVSRETATSQAITLEEVVVTAQKKSERLQDVPIPVTVLNAARLLENSQLRLQGLFLQRAGIDRHCGRR